MGTYATTTSFSNLIPFLMGGNSTGSDPDTANVISAHITRAESVINSSLIARYDIPFSTVPPQVRMWAEDIASYMIIRGAYVQDGQLRNEYHQDYERAFEELKMAREGKFALTDTDGSLIATKSSSRFLSSTKSYTPIFQLDEARQWNVDPDQLDDIDDTR